MTWRILLCSDGSPAAAMGATMLAALRLIHNSQISILGVLEPGHEPSRLQRALQDQASGLEAPGTHLDIRLRPGHAAEEILAEAESSAYDLVVVGTHGSRGLTRFRLGSTAGRLARHLTTSLLVCRQVPPAVQRILVCISGEEPSADTLRVGGSVAAGAGATIRLVHVMSQVALSWESPSDDLEATAEMAMERKSREGLLLARGMEALRTTAPGVTVTPRLRHGLVVDEVLAEIRHGTDQLLVIGAHRAPEASARLAPFLDDVADQLLTHAPCSVLIVRSK